MKKFVTECVVALLMLIATVSHAQNPTTMGTDFWVAYLDLRSLNDLHLLSFFADTSGTVYIMNPTTGWTDTVSVAASTESRYTVPSVQVVHNTSDVVDGKGLYVHSTMPMSVYAYNKDTELSSMDGTQILPVGSLGCQYVVSTYPATTDVSASDRSSFVVMAVGEKYSGMQVYNDTTIVDIYFSGASQGNASGTHQVVTLAAGQTFHVLGYNDLSGTLIQSRNGKKIAVFSGDKLVRVPQGTVGGDYLYTQLHPTQSWGKEFVVMPTQDHDISYMRVTSLFDSCSIFCNGAFQTTINQYQTFEMQLTQTTVVTTTMPVEVVNCMPSRTCSAPNCYWGDAAFTTITPVEQASNRGVFFTYPFSSRAGNAPIFYLDVAVPVADSSSLILDGDSLSGFSVVQSYAVKRMQIAAGTHTLSASDSSYFVATTSGVDENWGGYLYSINGNCNSILDMSEVLAVTSASLSAVDNDTIRICSNGMLALSVASGTIWDSVWWEFDGDTIIVGDSIEYAIPSAGSHYVVVYALPAYPFSAMCGVVSQRYVVETSPADTILAIQGTCDSYIIFNDHIYTENTDVLINTRPNEAGCDTLEILRLVFYPSYDTTMHVELPIGSEYQWIDGNIYSHNNNSATVMLQSVHGCDSLVRLDLRFYSEGISSITGEGTVSMIPNPSTDRVRIASDEQIMSLELFDMQGRVVRKDAVAAFEVELNLGYLPRGMYLVKVITLSGVMVKQLILE